MDLSFTVMAHPNRKHFIPDLGKRLPEGTPVVWDQNNDRWDTGRRALLKFNPEADYHIVVQDDAVLCKDFTRAASKVLDAAPYKGPVSFYMGKPRPFREKIEAAVYGARMKKANFVGTIGPLWGVGIALPTENIDELVKECDDMEFNNYDFRICQYWARRDIGCLYTVPSLVDHRSGNENPSLVEGRTSKHRTAYYFAGERSPLHYKWSSKVHIVPSPIEQ